jgi:hypothetical protein
MDSAFEIIFACKKGATIARNLMQPFNIPPTLVGGLPEGPSETSQKQGNANGASRAINGRNELK